MNRTVSRAGRHAIMLREGVRLHAYQDTRGIWTIGVGHTSAAGPPSVHQGLTITMDDCDAILARDLEATERAVNAAIRVDISQNAFDACVSLAYNIGAFGFRGSSVVRAINAVNMPEAANDFLMWDRPPELLGRRKGERSQFLRRDSPTGRDAEAPAGSIAWVQDRLNAEGASPQLAIDGDLGPATTGAIRAYQAAHGLLVDGIAGPATLASMGFRNAA